MRWLDRLLKSLGLVRASKAAVSVDWSLLPHLQELADEEDITIERMTQEILFQGIELRRQAYESLDNWYDLTPREREVAALTCLGLTNQQIAERLVISKNTVKAHLRSILKKFNCKSKVELQDALSGWDFSSWLPGHRL